MSAPGHPSRFIELLEGIELATKVIDGAPAGPEAAEWLRYRARLYRRLHTECPKSRLSGTALATAETDDARADHLTPERTP